MDFSCALQRRKGKGEGESRGRKMEEEPELWEPLASFLAHHPSYYEVFQESIQQLLYGDGPLPLPYRHFIALMAAARHNCAFLHHLHSSEFLRLGGSPDWLRLGLPAAPLKLRQLDSLNRTLAHQPWLIDTPTLLALTRAPSPHNWSLSELIHGAIILSHTHSLASFIRGCGILSSQPPSPSALPRPPPSLPLDVPCSLLDENVQPAVSPASEVELLLARMKAMADAEPITALSSEQQSQLFEQVIAPESDKATPRSPNSLSPRLPPSSSSAAASTTPPATRQSTPLSTPQSSQPAHFSEELAFQYVDFVKRPQAQAHPTFKIHDYSWEDEGYSVVSQLYGEFSDLLDKKFSDARSLTYLTCGPYSGVDTRPFRTALWVYIQSLFGIRHDDYDYHQINQLLERPLKELVKTLTCFPHRTSDALRRGVLTQLLLSERVHVVLLISEARQQSELLYFLRALTRLLSHSPSPT